MTAKAEKHDKYWLNIAIAAVIYFGVRFFVPAVEPLTPAGVQVIGIFFATMYLWITTDTVWASLLSIFLFVTTGLFTPGNALQRSFGSSVTTMVLFVFMFNELLRETGFLRRLAVWFCTRKFVAGRPWAFISMFLLATLFVGSFMSLTATCLVFLALLSETLASVGYEKGGKDKVGLIMAVGVAWLSTMSSSATPFGHPYTMMGMQYAIDNYGANVTMTSYLAIGLTVAVLTTVIYILVCKFIVRPDVEKLKNINIEALKATVGPMESREKIAVAGYMVVLLIWLLPTFFADVPGVIGIVFTWLKGLGSAVPVMIMIAVMGMLRINGKPVMDVGATMQKVSWSTLCFIAGAMVVGDAIVADGAGIVEFLKTTIGPAIGTFGAAGVVIFGISWVVIQTSFMPNGICVVLVNIIAPIAAATAGVNPAVIAVLCGTASNLAYPTASATSTTAIVLGEKWVESGWLAKYGFAFAVLSIVILCVICYPLGCLLWPM